MKRSIRSNGRSGSHLALRVAALVMAAGGTARAEILYWKAAASGPWSSLTHWNDPGDFPNSLAEVALIDATGANYTVTIDFSPVVEAFTLGSANATLNISGAQFLYVGAVSPDSYLHVAGGTFNVTGGPTVKCERHIVMNGPAAAINLNNGRLEAPAIVLAEGLVTSSNGFFDANYLDLGNVSGRKLVRIPDAGVMRFIRPNSVIQGQGTISSESSYYGSTISIQEDLTFLSGEIALSNHPGNYIYAPDNGVDADKVFTIQGTIRGSGNVGYNLTTLLNYGDIVADQSHSLTVDPNAEGLDNRGDLIARTGGTLVLLNGLFFGSGSGTSRVIAESASNAVLQNARVTNHLLTTVGSGRVLLRNNSIVESTQPFATAITGSVNIEDAHAATFLGPASILPTGSINLLSSYYGSTMNLGANVELNGGGVVTASNHPGNYVSSSTAGAYTLTNSGVTFRGAGQLGNNSIGINNTASGIITAQGTHSLFINPSDGLGMSNDGIVASAANSPLFLVGPGFTNTGLFNADTAKFYLSNATIVNNVGGEFISTDGGAFEVSAGYADIAGLDLLGTLNVPDSLRLDLRVSATNDGVINSQSGYYGSTIRIVGGDCTLTGVGEVVLSNHPGNYITADVSGRRLINNENTIRGAGQVGNNTLAITNDATIRAQGTHGMYVNPADVGIDGQPGLVNNALVSSSPNSALFVVGAGIENNGLFVADAGTFHLSNATVDNTGTFVSDNGGVFAVHTGAAEIRNLALAGVLNVPDSLRLDLRESAFNEGVINSLSSYYGSTIRVVGEDCTLSGGGLVNLSNHPSNYIYSDVSGRRLVNIDNTIQGAGQVGYNTLAITNGATIIASGSHGLYLNPADAGIDGSPGLVNNALVSSSGNSPMVLVGGGIRNNGSFVAAGGAFHLSGATIDNAGLFESLNGGVFQTHGAFADIANLTLTGTLNVLDSHRLDLRGTATNDGVINSQSSYYGSTIRLVGGNVTLAGSGQIALSNHPSNFITGDAAHTLTNAGNTIRGGGQVGNNTIGIVNGPAGTILADAGNTMFVNPENSLGFANQGTLLITGPGGMQIGDGPFTTSGTIVVDATRKFDRTSGDVTQTGGTTLANGEFEVDSNNYLLQGGTLGGSGLVDSNVVNSGGAVAPGNSPGTLTIEGNYTQQAGGGLTIEIAGKASGEFDRLAVTGSVALGGTLRMFNVDFVADPGDQVTILTAGATMTGVFDAIVQPPSGPRWGVTYLAKSVVLTAFCGADFDNTGFVDTDDFTAFVFAFEEGTENADFDGSGFVDTDDFTAFVIAFESGC